MRTRQLMLTTIVLLGAGAVALRAGQSAAARNTELTTAVAMAAVVQAEGEYSYVGSAKCKMCHIKEYKSWADTKMGKAFDSLKPGEAAEVKTAHGLDPEKDYTQDESCISCHVTGFGHEGGYAIPAADDAKAAKKAKKLAGVGCESCHGPGSAYIEIFKEIFKSKRKYKVEELHAAGLTKIDESTCTTCHNDKSPTFEKFDFEAQKAEGLHERVEMELREE